MENKRINGFMCRLPVEKIFPHPENPRKDLGDLSELAASIKVRGVLQNLTVVPRVVDGQEVEDEYWAVIGNRRHAAAKLAGLAEVPCVIADMTPKEQFETMMIENVQRNDLTVYEQAKGFLVKDGHMFCVENTETGQFVPAAKLLEQGDGGKGR